MYINFKLKNKHSAGNLYKCLGQVLHGGEQGGLILIVNAKYNTLLTLKRNYLVHNHKICSLILKPNCLTLSCQTILNIIAH